MLNLKSSLAVITVTCCCLIHTIKADIIEHGDFEGSALHFNNVIESADEDVFPLFGAPMVQGNSLVFSNPGFSAVVGENSVDFLDGRLSLDVVAKNNKDIYGFRLSETGSFLSVGDDVDVFVSGIAFAIADGTLYDASFQHWDNTAGEGKWSGNLVVEFPEPVQSFRFVVDNQLFAQAGAASSASVDKDQIKLTITVPEPASAYLVVVTAATIGLVSRRRRST